MIRLGLASAAVILIAAAAFSVALFAVSGASEAEQTASGEQTASEEQTAPETTVAQPFSLDQSQAESASEAQYSNGPNEDGGTPAAGTPPTNYYDFYTQWLAQEGNPTEVSEIEDTPSEGSAPGVRAPAWALSVMEPPTPYSQTVDNASRRSYFSKRAWKKSSRGERHYGKNYEYIKPKRGAPPAWFKVKIPTAGRYTVYARWPAARRNNPAAHFRISTISGLETAEVNQRKDGGMWVRLGAYEMKAGNRYSVRVAGYSKARGRVVADAVRVVRGTQVAQPREASRDWGGGVTAGGAAGGEISGGEAAGGEAAASEVIQRARTHIGTPYRHSPPLPCEAYRSEDCSCFTSLVFSKWLALPDDPVQQWQVGHSVEMSDLRPGDLVFFKEAGMSNPITHVGIYSGSGNIIHSSSYWGKVVERPMQYVNGYYGAKRLT